MASSPAARPPAPAPALPVATESRPQPKIAARVEEALHAPVPAQEEAPALEEDPAANSPQPAIPDVDELSDPESTTDDTGDPDRWEGMSTGSWQGAAAAQSAGEPAARKPRRSEQADDSAADTQLTLEQALQRISPEARKVLRERLKGEIRELRRYAPR